jgi:aspartyl-tRNA(Asn)/glutamyl-tRNA(Gln) amidotransferase subunit C
MAITREEVLHVAKLARLELTDDEVERLTEQLGAILEAVSKVSELDLSDVPPTSHPLELVNAWAPDELRESLEIDQRLLPDVWEANRRRNADDKGIGRDRRGSDVPGQRLPRA